MLSPTFILMPETDSLGSQGQAARFLYKRIDALVACTANFSSHLVNSSDNYDKQSIALESSAYYF